MQNQFNFNAALPKVAYSHTKNSWFHFAMKIALEQYRADYDIAMGETKTNPDKLINVLIKIVNRAYDIMEKKNCAYMLEKAG